MSRQSEVNKLTKHWYKKLKDTGFEDIEDNKGVLKEWTSRFYLSHITETNGSDYKDKIIVNEAKAEYYRLAEHFLNSHTFADGIEKSIWNLHSQGFSFRNIAKTLKSAGIRPINKDKIGLIIKRLFKMVMQENKEQQDDNQQE